MVSRVLQGLKLVRLWLAVGLGLIVLVIYLSLTPAPIEAPRIEDVKSGHFIAYLVLVLWFWQLLRPRWARLAMAAGFVLMGVVLEYAQGMTDYRTFAFSDMRDNALGVAVGLVLGMTPLGGALGKLEEWLAL